MTRTVTTTCCKVISVRLSTQHMQVGHPAINARCVSVEHLPSTSIPHQRLDRVAQQPHLHTLTHIYSTLLFSLCSIDERRDEQYHSSWQLLHCCDNSGPSSAEFNVSYVAGRRIVRVRTSAECPPPPQLLSTLSLFSSFSVTSMFASSSSSVASGLFSCSMLVAFTGATFSSCKWSSNNDQILVSSNPIV